MPTTDEWGNSDPYRTPAKQYSLDDEMLEALLFLKDWERFNPVIAGGAIWAWAAGNPARDIDVFVHDSWRTRRKARQEGMSRSVGSLLSESYDSYSGVSGRDVPVKRYLGTLKSGKPIDLVLVPWRKGEHALDHFDYEHCRVGFGKDFMQVSGGNSYAEGKLKKVIDWSPARSQELVSSKVQRGLWGNPEAVHRLVDTLLRLQRLYKQV